MIYMNGLDYANIVATCIKHQYGPRGIEILTSEIDKSATFAS